MTESEIFQAALKLSPEDRAAYLDQVCRTNPELRGEVEALLHAHEVSGGILQDLPQRPARTGDYEPITERPGSVIGSYRLMEQIGEGGFGLVFVAEQTHPVRRKVALKIIKPGMDTRDVVARFEAERQALALMDHPNIARVFDGGTTESGRPFFVMELVKGIPITDYCDQHLLTAAERLQLFVSVCQAVQHAHAKGVIHRDLKPSNILVAPHDGVPVVKVIDFGVAKAIGQQLTEKTIYTRFAQMVGTPLYMSPEQAEINALDVDIRSDVYSLGVLLYELLTGTTPFDRQRFQKAAYDEIRRIIKEEDPPKPSTRLSTMGDALSRVSTRRKTEPAQLSALVKGDLDWIVMKALEKDRSRRYETAVSLARDIQRYLVNDPVEACPPSVGYRLRKFVRRNRGPVLATSAIVALLCLGLAGTIVGMVRAQRAAQVAAEARMAALEQRDEREKALQLAALAQERAILQRDQAQAARQALREALYVSHMNLLQSAWEANNTSRVLEILEATRPGQGEPDLRGFEWHYWDRLCHAELRTRKLDFGPAPQQARGEFVAFSQDGRRCAALALRDPARPNEVLVRVWDTARAQELWAFPLDETAPLMIALSGDGQRLAVSVTPLNGAAGKITVWDISARKEVATVKTAASGRLRSRVPAWDLQPVLNRDGHRLAAFVRAGVGEARLPGFLVWDLDAGAQAAPRTFPGIAPGASLSPDGKQLATIGLTTKDPAQGLRYELRILDVETGKVVQKAPWPTAVGPQAAVGPNHLDATMLRFSPDGTRIAAVQFHRAMPTALPLHQVAVWDTQGKMLSSFQSTTRISYLSFSPDGQHLVTWTGARNGVGDVWETATGSRTRTWKGPISPMVGVAFNAEGTRVYSVDLGGTLREWDAIASDFHQSPRERDQATIWSMDGSRHCRFVRARVADGISVRDATGRPVFTFKEHKAPISGVVLSFDGRFAVSFDEGGTVLVWETATGQVGVRQQWPSAQQKTPSPRFSSDGKRLAMNVPEGGVKVWDLTRETIERFTCPVGARELVFGPGGHRLVTSAEGGTRGVRERTFTIWDVDNGRQLCVLKGRLSHLVFSPDERWIAARLPVEGRTPLFALNAPIEVGVWNTTTGAVRAHLKGDLLSGGIAFSPDGKYLATPTRSSIDSAGDIVVWDLESSKPHLKLKGHSVTANGLLFSPDGRRIVSTAQGVNPSHCEVKLWEARGGTEVLTLKARGLVDLEPLLFFSAKGQKLYMMGNNGVTEWGQVWNATPREEPRKP